MMSSTVAVLYTMVQLIVLAGLGVYLRRVRGWPEAFFRRLSTFFVRIVLPVYFFVRMARIDLDSLSGAVAFPLVAVAFVGVSLLLSFILFSAIGLRGGDRRAALALGSFGNSGYIPITVTEIFPIAFPIITEVLDPNLALAYIGAYVFAFSPLLWSVGNLIITGTGTRIHPRRLLSPPLLGISLGLLVPILGVGPVIFNESLPFFHVFSALERLSALTLPLALVSLGAIIGGLRIPREEWKGHGKIAAGVAALRFVLYPALFFGAYFGILRPLDAPPVVLWVLFAEMTVPPANNLAIMTATAGTNQHYAGFTLLVNYSLYLVMFPIALILFLSLPGIPSG